MVRAARQKVLLNKPIAVGFCILELSKLTMYSAILTTGQTGHSPGPPSC